MPAKRDFEARFCFDAATAMRLAQWLRDDVQNARLSRSFRAFYQVRSLLPIPVRQLLQRWRRAGSPLADDWHLPQSLIQAWSREAPPPFQWPEQAGISFVLTHDVETARGLELVPALAELEQRLGFRSSWNLIPYKYPIDSGLVADLQQRGFEIGVHGYNHDGRLFTSESVFRRRLPMINEALRNYAASGFRAPMVHRNLHWMQGLEVEYDASCFDVDPLQAMPGGVGSLWPFMAGHFVELPYTLPQDHTLLVVMGELTDRIWRHKLEFIRRWSGMALMLTHPDYLDSPHRLAVYRGFLERVRDEGDYWHALPREVAAWSRERIACLDTPSFSIPAASGSRESLLSSSSQ